MKDFDAERTESHAEREKQMGDRDFILAGKTFTYKANTRYNVLTELASLTGETSGTRIIGVLERTACDLVEGDTEEFLAALRSDNGTPPVSFHDLNALVSWLVAEQVRRPTVAPSSSTDGRETTGTPSKDISSSPPAEDSKT